MFTLKMPEPLFTLTRWCETNCVAGCCGLAAFRVEAGEIVAFVRDRGVPTAIEALEQLEAITDAILARGEPVDSPMDDFNERWESPAACLDFLEEFHTETLKAILSESRGTMFRTEWVASDAVRNLVRAVQSGEFDSLPVLADALEEAGCDQPTILRHCRARTPHGRRCWVADLLAIGADAIGGTIRLREPLTNRVTPTGLIISTAARGTLMGNRGRLHDGRQDVVRNFVGRRWLLCSLEFKGRRREVMRDGYTELFFLDEATGLSAGHRPCAECQRARYRAFRDAWQRGNGRSVQSAEQLDAELHRERLPIGAARSTFAERFANLPDGVMLLLGGNPHLKWAGRLRPWHPEGYGEPVSPPNHRRVDVLTPFTVVRAIAAGLPVGVHASAMVESA